MKRKTSDSKINSTLCKPLTDDSQLLFKLKASGVMQTERWKLKEVAIILHFKISSGYVSLFMCLDRSSQAFHFVHALVSFHLPLQSVCQGSLNKTLNSESYSSIVLLLEYLFSAVWSKFYSVVLCFFDVILKSLSHKLEKKKKQYRCLLSFSALSCFWFIILTWLQAQNKVENMHVISCSSFFSF